jgi:hypothetical protein
LKERTTDLRGYSRIQTNTDNTSYLHSPWHSLVDVRVKYLFLIRNPRSSAVKVNFGRQNIHQKSGYIG